MILVLGEKRNEQLNYETQLPDQETSTWLEIKKEKEKR